VSSDMRIHSLRLLRGLGATELVAYLYPRIFALHAMSDIVFMASSSVADHSGGILR
jgi:hypothetical protein